MRGFANNDAHLNPQPRGEELTATAETVYCLPGRGGRLHEGLGKALLARGLDVVGQEMSGVFAGQTFAQQVSIIARDLQEHHWNDRAFVIANSFGAYLFLHAQAELPPYVGRVLLLSPIVGDVYHEAQAVGFVPPHAGVLRELAAAGKYPTPLDCHIHVGADDWQSNPARVQELGELLGIPVYVVPNNGHMLDKSYVSAVLDEWVCERIE